MALFDAVKPVFGDEEEADKKYSLKVSPPQYLPNEKAPEIYELCNKSKYIELLRNINTSDIPDDVKEFLRLGATRHIVFNYSKIADYYAHTTPDIQRLMEQSALVIIDIDDAIQNGYVRLSETIKTIMSESGESTK